MSGRLLGHRVKVTDTRYERDALHAMIDTMFDRLDEDETPLSAGDIEIDVEFDPQFLVEYLHLKWRPKA